MIQPGERTFETLLECKKIRESLGGENHHFEQCNKIPENLKGIKFLYHRKCFQKFVYAKTLLKRKAAKEDDKGLNAKLQRTTRETLQKTKAAGSRGLFASICMICKKKDLKVKGERQPLPKILTATAEKTMKDAAIAHNDLQMIIAVSETGLIAKEFKNMINAI